MALCDPCYNLVHILEQHHIRPKQHREQETLKETWEDQYGYQYFPSSSSVTAFRDWLSARNDKSSIPETLPQLPGLIHSSWDSFCKSLDSFCPVCWVVWRHIRDSPATSYHDENRSGFWLSFHHGLDLTGNTGLIELNCSADIRDADNIVFSYARTTKQRFQEVVAGIPLEGHMGSKTTVNTVKGWLSMCEGGDRCVAKRRAVSDPIIPTRLIDVHTYGSQFWSVVETNNHQSFSKYVALSHRWVADTPRLLRNNYLAFQMGQSDDVVPRSYQDVFVLCRKLDIRYVWIDSLCIFQDSADDFLHEAATMIEVYANAFCTFSIGWESPHGFLRPRNTRALLRWNTDNLNGLVPPDRHLFVHDHRELRETIGQTPLNRRGWVLQEQLLSPRILHLGNDQLYWECDGRISSETEPDGLLPHGSDYRRKMLVDNGESESSTWQDLVVQFMRLDLTFERDRLLAVSGIARFLLTSSENGLPEGNGSYSYRKVERKVDPTTEYVAGLRRFHWIKDLLWQPMIFPQRWIEDDVKVNRGSFNRCPDNIVPSWSWAACPGPIRWTVEPFDVWHHDVSDEGGPVACLRNINFELLGSDIYGLPKSASLDISGLLIPAKHTELDGPEYHPNGVEATSNQQYFYLYTDGFMYPLPYPRVHGDVRSLITAPLESCDSFTPTCFIIPLISLSIWKDPKTMGLVVQERPRAGDGLREFVRVGSFTRYHKPDHNRQDCAGLAIMNAILKNVPADGDKFEQKLRDSAYWWEDYERAGMEDGHDATAKAEWTTIRLV